MIAQCDCARVWMWRYVNKYTCVYIYIYIYIYIFIRWAGCVAKATCSHQPWENTRLLRSTSRFSEALFDKGSVSFTKGIWNAVLRIVLGIFSQRT